MDAQQQALLRELKHRIGEHLRVLYPAGPINALTDQLINAMDMESNLQSPRPHHNHWDETDSILVTYGNSISKAGERPLCTLHRFLDRYLDGVIEAVHILPFSPFSSDDGFAVMEYLQVNPSLGGWEDIEAISARYKLMADVVINHVSSRSRWFNNFKQCRDPGKDYFILGNPKDDLSGVVRPRNSPLLTRYETAQGIRHVWCTFSADQVDLNFRNPQVLIEFVRIIKQYLDHGVALFRMDAVPFLWKEVGTACVHLQQTHELVKLLRTLIEHHSPQAVLICENNVPTRENLTYFGNANEAHIIYNFPLPPLLIFTLLSGDCRHLKTWMMSMPPARSGTAYLNFIASHDGIGLRPLDGLLDNQERDRLIDTIKRFGGRITLRKSREGYDKPYEMNIALFDALKGTLEGGEDEWGDQRFICAHAIMLALEGIPAIYIHSLFGSRNDYRRLEHTGRNRSINRPIWQEQELEEALSAQDSHHGRIFRQLCRLISVRKQHAAFHPNATQFTLHLGTKVFAFWRQSMNCDQSIFCLSNVTHLPQSINLADINLITTDTWHELLSDERYENLKKPLHLGPYQTVWISNR